RNALLRRVRAGEASAAPLAGFTEELVRAGGWVRAARARLVAALQPLAAEGLAVLSDGSERLGLAYAVDGEGGETAATDPEDASEALARTLRRRAGDELARGATLAGPHRDDVVITLDGRPARAAASQGQQRSIVLAWKLAECARWRRPPGPRRCSCSTTSSASSTASAADGCSTSSGPDAAPRRC